eukprot:TRINITY_DN729_c0_g1_i2.p1 TRINITY_DN729_c0_g1~~TRINITY_DN729_c0_g1_i2.p1  ORF type:complete len:261 (-),score=68.05 TRINITY_DN729_c0_g1_i2:774-1556(-)
MPRKKPFSGKQKREQLKNKKKQKEEDEQYQHGDGFIRQLGRRKQGRRRRGKKNAAASSQSGGESAAPRPQHGNGGGGGFGPRNKLNTVFERESKEEVLRRVEDSARKIDYVTGPESIDFSGPSGELIPIPRRPDWDFSMSKAELDRNEVRAITEWIDAVYKYPRSRLNHFEHNLEVWRQLWRVCEMSEILVVVVDVRHPLIHFPRSLYEYVTRTLKKPMVVVFNKVRALHVNGISRLICRLVPFHARCFFSTQMRVSSPH